MEIERKWMVKGWPVEDYPVDNEKMMRQGYLSVNPTSLFVDKDGKILASPIVGAVPAAYSQTLESLLAEISAGNAR